MLKFLWIVCQTNLQISLQNHRSCCPKTFSAYMSCIQSMLFPKKNDEDYWLYGYHAKVTQHCKLSAKKILLISKTCSESSSDFFAPFISEIALKRIVHRLSNIFLSQAISYSIALFWSDNTVMAIKVSGLQNFLIFPCQTCKNYSSSLGFFWTTSIGLNSIGFPFGSLNLWKV